MKLWCGGGQKKQVCVSIKVVMYSCFHLYAFENISVQNYGHTYTSSHKMAKKKTLVIFFVLTNV